MSQTPAEPTLPREAALDADPDERLIIDLMLAPSTNQVPSL